MLTNSTSTRARDAAAAPRQEWDYVIVGGGSAGCVLANRLSADPATRVLLIEAGGTNRSPVVSVPKGMGRAVLDPRYIWAYSPRAPNPRPVAETWLRGRGLGGSSAINGMIYVRGHPADYAAWADVAGADWGWQAMRAAFRAIEDHALGDDGNRGVGGPLHVEPVRMRDALTERLIAAGEAMGLPRCDDLSDERQEGIGYSIQNVRRGRRQSAAVAFLDPVRHRPNLRIEIGFLVDRILFEGTRAIGVEGRTGGRSERRLAVREVIVTAGSMNTPRLLMLSGIGPRAVLSAAGVPLRIDAPRIGRNLREHMGMIVSHRLTGARGLNGRYRGLGLLRSFAEYGLRRGPLATGPWEVGGFARSDPSLGRPDFQMYLGASTLALPVGRGRFRRTGTGAEPGITIYGMLNRLRGEGSITITAADPDAPLDIDHPWLSCPEDERAALGMMRFIRAMFEQPVLADVCGEELLPGAAARDDAAILAAYRAIGTAGLHAVGTCAMGDAADAPLDRTLRVRGTAGLRVVDCSAMPSLVCGNTNGPAMAFAWRAADVILADAAAEPTAARGHEEWSAAL